MTTNTDIENQVAADNAKKPWHKTTTGMTTLAIAGVAVLTLCIVLPLHFAGGEAPTIAEKQAQAITDIQALIAEKVQTAAANCAAGNDHCADNNQALAELADTLAETRAAHAIANAWRANRAAAESAAPATVEPATGETAEPATELSGAFEDLSEDEQADIMADLLETVAAHQDALTEEGLAEARRTGLLPDLAETVEATEDATVEATAARRSSLTPDVLDQIKTAAADASETPAAPEHSTTVETPAAPEHSTTVETPAAPEHSTTVETPHKALAVMKLRCQVNQYAQEYIMRIHHLIPGTEDPEIDRDLGLAGAKANEMNETKAPIEEMPSETCDEILAAYAQSIKAGDAALESALWPDAAPESSTAGETAEAN